MGNITIEKLMIIKHLIGFIGGAILFFILTAGYEDNWLGRLEGHYLPVIGLTSFRVSPAEDQFEIREFGLTELSGTLDKYRECEFLRIEAIIYDVDNHSSAVDLTMLDPAVVRHIGKDFKWGPWLLKARYRDVVTKNLRIELYAVHQCHPFFETVTHLR